MAPVRRKTVAILAGAVLAVVAALRAADVKLAPRYIDPRNGFSLRPPAGAERSRRYSSSRLVRWSMRDERSRAIAWTLTVRKESGPDPGVTLKAFTEALAARLSRPSDVRVESVLPAKLLGKDALYVRMESGEKARRWHYELWVLADARRFLVLSMDGPLGAKDRLEAIGREVAATLRLTDPESLAAQRKANLQRGGGLLKKLSAEKLTSAVSAEPRWYLYRKGGRDIGFLHVAERMVGRGPARGIEVRTFARLELKRGQVLHSRRPLFTTADRTAESWRELVQIRAAGKLVRTLSESGSAAGGAIICKVTADGKSSTRKKTLPAATAAHYLPRALAIMLPRLTDLTRPGAYAFAAYTTAANDLDMRTFTVMGREKMTLGAKSIEAVRASDQVAADAEPATLHVRDDGLLLRMQTAVGITMELATRSAVLRRYADADALVKGR